MKGSHHSGGRGRKSRSLEANLSCTVRIYQKGGEEVKTERKEGRENKKGGREGSREKGMDGQTEGRLKLKQLDPMSPCTQTSLGHIGRCHIQRKDSPPPPHLLPLILG